VSALRIQAPVRIRNQRTARTAAQQRAARTARGRYATVGRITLFTAAGLAILLSYVLLVANITSLSYGVDRAHAQRSELQAQVTREQDAIDSLTSDDRLATVAAKLGMVQPTQFVRVSLLPQRAPQSRPLAFLAR
jgi:cell division protein FtsL